jgi:hypothetical protein
MLWTPMYGYASVSLCDLRGFVFERGGAEAGSQEPTKKDVA